MSSLHDITCARIPHGSLAALGRLRCAREVGVVVDGADCWLHWPAGSEEILRQVLPLPGVELYRQREGQWYRHGSRLPSVGPPQRERVHLDRLLAPARFAPLPPTADGFAPLRLRLVRDDAARPTTALECALPALTAWADTATTQQIAAVRGALAGGRVRLLGAALPLLPAAQRFWGQRILTPLGFRPEPGLPEGALGDVLRLGANQLALLHAAGAEVMSFAAFTPLSRAAIRLAGEAAR